MPAPATHLAIVTGTSSGIGAALAHELLDRGWRVVGISRRPSDIAHPEYRHVPLDLGDLAILTDALDRELGAFVAADGIERIALVNNAADIGLLGTIERLDAARLGEVFAVNVAAPIALSGWLLRSAHPDTTIRIADLSTGAARNPYPGLGAYGSSKAALRLAGMILAEELDAAEQGGAAARDVALLSYEPGVVDTEMQADLRATTADQLPMRDYFVGISRDGRLVPASAPAREIADFLMDDALPRHSHRRLGSR